MELKEMCRIVYPYTCPVCGNNMLFFTRARNNMIIDYKALIENMPNDDIIEYLSERNIEYLKCIACQKMFIIDWSRGYARPLRDKSVLEHFGYKFKE